MAQTPVKLGTFKDLLLDRQIEELVSYARSVAESTSGTAEAPTTISAITTAGGFGHVRLEYSYTSYNSHKYTEIWRSADTTFANAERVGATAAHFYQDFPPAPQISDVYYYWARNVNMDGVAGDLYGPVSGSVGSNPDYDLEMLLGQLGFGHFASGTYPIRTEPTLPTLPATNYPVGCIIYLTTNQLLYKNVNEAWQPVMAAADMVGEITNTQIADGAISTPKLQALAVTANEMAASAVTAGKIAAGALVVDDGVMQNGYIKNAHIADATIDNAKINSLDGGKITANSITASKYNELRNSLIFNGWDSLDADFPFEAPFLLLSELTAIQSVKLSFKIMPYRAYSNSMASTVGRLHNHGGMTIEGNGNSNRFLYLDTTTLRLESNQDTQTIPFTGSDGHTHQSPYIYKDSAPDGGMVYCGNTSGSFYVVDTSRNVGDIISVPIQETRLHFHHWQFHVIHSTADIPDPYKYSVCVRNNHLELYAPSSSTKVTLSEYTTYNQDAHEHALAYGIFEESNSPSVTVNIDNGSGYGTPLGFAGDQLNLDLTSRLSGAGWKTLKFTASAMCRIAFVLECKLDISA